MLAKIDLLTKASAKVLLFFEMTKYFGEKVQKKCVFVGKMGFLWCFLRKRLA
jgi:hypothetical protein